MCWAETAEHVVMPFGRGNSRIHVLVWSPDLPMRRDIFEGYMCRPGGVMVRALDLRLKRSRVRLPAVPLSANNLGQVVHTCASVTKHYKLVPVKGQ